MKRILAILALALLALPAALADDTDWNRYGYGNYGYGAGYGSGASRGRSFESYSRTYDTNRNDVASHTVSSTDSGPGYGYYPSGTYPPTGDGFYFGGPRPPYPYDPAATRSHTFTDNYNRNYNEHTNEAIKVDKYIAYDDQGVVHLVSDGYGQRKPYFVTYDTYADPYVYRYPYSGYSTGDRGYAAQSYYSHSPADGQPMVVPSIARYPQRLPALSSVSHTPDEGPSQTYRNTITDRGPLYAPMRPSMASTAAKPTTESGGAMRNPEDRSVYDGAVDRDTMYVYNYGQGRRP